MKIRDAVTGLVWMGAMMLAGLACATPGAPDGVDRRAISRRRLLVGSGRALAASGVGLSAYGVPVRLPLREAVPA